MTLRRCVLLGVLVGLGLALLDLLFDYEQMDRMRDEIFVNGVLNFGLHVAGGMTAGALFYFLMTTVGPWKGTRKPPE